MRNMHIIKMRTTALITKNKRSCIKVNADDVHPLITAVKAYRKAILLEPQ